MVKNNTNENSQVPTPHISAKYGQIAERVLMPGDPKRAKWAAETFLKNVKLVTDVRGMSGYTGTYKKVPITIMAHGMGIPSIAIYTYELYNFYDAKVIYRIGSCGVGKECGAKIGEIVIVKSAWSDTPMEKWLGIKSDKKNIMLPTKSSLDNILKTAKEKQFHYKLLPVSSNSFFYLNIPYSTKKAMTHSDVSEMECFGLFAIAKMLNKKAGGILTVSDNIETGDSMDWMARQTSFTNMVKLALEAIIKEEVN